MPRPYNMGMIAKNNLPHKIFPSAPFVGYNHAIQRNMSRKRLIVHPNEALITKFYTAFQQLDSATMAACYHRDVTFSDSVFVNLKGDEARAMWAMLCGRAKDIQVNFSNVQANNATGSAHWEAYYTFGASGRKVHNVIEARYKFKDGLIIDHQDSFNFYRWSSQALGLPGMLLGWTPFLQRKVQTQSRATLDKYMASKVG